ncbi:MAG: glycosyltransferase family 2 protein [Anaerolineales bacterium]
MHCPTLNDLPAAPPDKQGWPWTEESQQLPETMPDGRPWPRISIVTPSCNQGPFIEETIRSILLQRYPNLEYIVIDGGSTDGTAEIIEKYDPWLEYWVSEEDKGQSHAINKGFARATGVVGNWINSDDSLCRSALLSIARVIPADRDSRYVIGAGGVIVNDEGHPVRTAAISPQPSGWPFSFSLALEGGIQPAYFFSLNLFRESGGVDPALHYVMDTDIFNRYGLIGYEAVSIPQQVARFRSHKDAKTRGFPYQMTLEKLHLYRTYSHIEPESTPNAMLHVAKRILRSNFAGAPIATRFAMLCFAFRTAPRLFLNRTNLYQIYRTVTA